MLDWVDLELLAFVERFAGKRILWKVTEYFGHNSQTPDTLEGIARHLGLDAADMCEYLRYLVNQGLLEDWMSDGQAYYRLTSEPHLRSMAKRFARMAWVAPGVSFQSMVNPGFAVV